MELSNQKWSMLNRFLAEDEDRSCYFLANNACSWDLDTPKPDRSATGQDLTYYSPVVDVSLSGDNEPSQFFAPTSPSPLWSIRDTTSDRDNSHGAPSNALIAQLGGQFSEFQRPWQESMSASLTHATSFDQTNVESQDDVEIQSQLPKSSLLSTVRSSPSDLATSGEISFVDGPAERDIQMFANELFPPQLLMELTETLASSLVAAFFLHHDNYSPRSRGSSGQGNSHRSGNRTTQTASLNAQQLSSTPSRTTRSSFLSKRRRMGSDDGDLPDERPHKQPSLIPSSPQEEKRLLACPYAKYDSTRYSERNEVERHYRGCSSSFLRDIPRVKQHLYRVHRPPLHHCYRCYEDLRNDDSLIEHSRQTPQCELQQCPFPEKMNSNQANTIKRREMRKETTQAWFDIYQILFPGAELPDSPYPDVSYDAGRMETFFEFFQNEAPRQIAAQATSMMCGPRHPQELQEWTEQILESCIARVIRQYRQEDSSGASGVDESS